MFKKIISAFLGSNEQDDQGTPSTDSYTTVQECHILNHDNTTPVIEDELEKPLMQPLSYHHQQQPIEQPSQQLEHFQEALEHPIYVGSEILRERQSSTSTDPLEGNTSSSMGSTDMETNISTSSSQSQYLEASSSIEPTNDIPVVPLVVENKKKPGRKSTANQNRVGIAEQHRPQSVPLPRVVYGLTTTNPNSVVTDNITSSSSEQRLTRLQQSGSTSLEQIREPPPTCSFVRRSTRDPSVYLMEKREIQDLLEKIRTNHNDTVVLKIKDHIRADINSSVMEAIIEALWVNTVCQGLYIQNLDKSITDVQMKQLIALFKDKMIWCLNIGENYEVSNAMWEEFCESLPQTNITHLYASEHVIDITLKNRMRDYIRENRKKHKKHCSMDNLAVIEKCTHMWWNPINGVKELKPLLPPPPPPPPPPPTPPPTAVQAKLDEWTFKCICGVRCCSKDDVKKHPIGRMYQCSTCDIWCHVVCVYGEALTDDELGKMDDVFCAPCKSIIKYDLSRVPGEWKFKCKCGEVCSHYENPLYHPVGAKYACTECGTFSHVLCMFGQKMSEEDLKKMPTLWCNACQSKRRRSRCGFDEPLMALPTYEAVKKKKPLNKNPNSSVVISVQNCLPSTTLAGAESGTVANYESSKSQLKADMSLHAAEIPTIARTAHGGNIAVKYETTEVRPLQCPLEVQNNVSVGIQSMATSEKTSDSSVPCFPARLSSTDIYTQNHLGLPSSSNHVTVSTDYLVPLHQLELPPSNLCQGHSIESFTRSEPTNIANYTDDDRDVAEILTEVRNKPSSQIAHKQPQYGILPVVQVAPQPFEGGKRLSPFDVPQSIMNVSESYPKNVGQLDKFVNQSSINVPFDQVSGETHGDGLLSSKKRRRESQPRSHDHYNIVEKGIEHGSENVAIPYARTTEDLVIEPNGRQHLSSSKSANRKLSNITSTSSNSTQRPTSTPTPKKSGRPPNKGQSSSNTNSTSNSNKKTNESGKKQESRRNDSDRKKRKRSGGDDDNDSSDSDPEPDAKKFEQSKKGGRKKKETVIVTTDLTEVPFNWGFDCSCGEKCSYYEKAIYHPKMLKYSCTECANFCHVSCMFPNEKNIEETLPYFEEALCFRCRTKRRRSRHGDVLEELTSFKSTGSATKSSSHLSKANLESHVLEEVPPVGQISSSMTLADQSGSKRKRGRQPRSLEHAVSKELSFDKVESSFISPSIQDDYQVQSTDAISAEPRFDQFPDRHVVSTIDDLPPPEHSIAASIEDVVTSSEHQPISASLDAASDDRIAELQPANDAPSHFQVPEEQISQPDSHTCPENQAIAITCALPPLLEVVDQSKSEVPHLVHHHVETFHVGKTPGKVNEVNHDGSDKKPVLTYGKKQTTSRLAMYPADEVALLPSFKPVHVASPYSVHLPGISVAANLNDSLSKTIDAVENETEVIPRMAALEDLEGEVNPLSQVPLEEVYQSRQMEIDQSESHAQLTTPFEEQPQLIENAITIEPTSAQTPSLDTSDIKKPIVTFELYKLPGEWKFKCRCGEVCSYYEKARFQPKRLKYSCVDCGVFSHAECMFGERITMEELQQRQVLYCNMCQSKRRRSRSSIDPAAVAVVPVSTKKRRSHTPAQATKVPTSAEQLITVQLPPPFSQGIVESQLQAVKLDVEVQIVNPLVQERGDVHSEIARIPSDEIVASDANDPIGTEMAPEKTTKRGGSPMFASPTFNNMASKLRSPQTWASHPSETLSHLQEIKSYREVKELAEERSAILSVTITEEEDMVE